MKENRKIITVATTISADGQIKAGGANVVHELYKRLAHEFEVNIIYIAPYGEIRRVKSISEHLTEYVIPRSAQTQRLTHQLELETGAATLYDVGLLYYLKDTPQYLEVLKQFINKSDLVMLDRPYLFPYVHMFSNGRPIIHRSQNVEYYYRMANMPHTPKTQSVLRDLFNIEKACCNYSDVTFSCSQKDLNEMHQIYQTPNAKLMLLSNGVSAGDNPMISIQKRLEMKKKFRLQDNTLAMFIGVGHKPNIEAVDKITRIAPFCPKTIFVIVGDICNYLLKVKRPENIILLGRVCEEERKFLFSIVDVALNPMYSGSGSNIKMFDYMSMGIPIISTEFGMRGIHDTRYILCADTDEDFITLLNDFNIEDCIDNVENNRIMIEEVYDWEVISNNTIDVLKKIIQGEEKGV